MAGRGGTVGIVGAGTMGAGIAQVAAQAGWDVMLSDVDAATVDRAIAGVRAGLDRLVEKGRLGAAERDAAAGRLRAAAGPASFAGCALLLEAVVEVFEVKVEALEPLLGVVSREAIIATNTSSLPVTRLGERLGQAHRTVGMHFFNPAPVMKLVEIVVGPRTDPAVADRAAAIAEGWGKVVVRAADVPGFIVNQVARPYYLEAFRVLEEGWAGPETIDAAMRDLGGFRMGPLELTDLIGQDVNAATTRQVWERLGRPEALRPSPLQERLVEQGHLGRKTGRGVYSYASDPPVPAVTVDRRRPRLSRELLDAVEAFAGGRELEQAIFARILASVIDRAARAEATGVASRRDIDTALRHGANYPRGPFEWAEQIGREVCERLLRALRTPTRSVSA